MNYSRIILAGLGGTVAYFAIGGLSFALVPQLADEFRKYPAIYRTQQGMKSVMPIGMAAMLVGILVLAVLYAMLYQSGSGAADRNFRRMRVRPVQLRELEHRADTDAPASGGLLHRVDGGGDLDRRHL